MENIISKILELGMSQGLWAMLYLYLFFRMLNENKQREDRYQETIKDLSTNIYAGIKQNQEQLDSVLDNKKD